MSCRLRQRKTLIKGQDENGCSYEAGTVQSDLGNVGRIEKEVGD